VNIVCHEKKCISCHEQLLAIDTGRNLQIRYIDLTVVLGDLYQHANI